MADHQLGSFVQKFRDLWARGFSAHLGLDCGGSEAWVGLRLRLDHHRAGGGQQAQGRGGKHRRGGSYAWRRERRAAVRTAAEQAASNAPVHAEEAVEVPAQAMGEGDGEVRGV